MHDNEILCDYEEVTNKTTASIENRDGEIRQQHAICGTPSTLPLCPWRCGEAVSMEKLSDHVFVCEKAKSESECPFQVLGCTFINYNVSRRRLDSFLVIILNVFRKFVYPFVFIRKSDLVQLKCHQ